MKKTKIIQPIFIRIGSKRQILDEVLKRIPKDHKTYVEPFCGCCIVLMNKDPSEIEVINDLDKNIIRAFYNMRKCSIDGEYPQDIKEIDESKEYFDKGRDQYKTREEKFVWDVLLLNTGFRGKNRVKGVRYNRKYIIENKVKMIEKYQDRMKDVKIYNCDYQEVMKKYDSEDTFFYLDPPYEGSREFNYPQYFKDEDYVKMRDYLKTIKGRFLLSLNDSQRIREIFKDFKIEEVKRKYKINQKTIGCNQRDELFITN